MSYSQFTLGQVKKAFQLTIVENSRFFPEICPIVPSSRLADELDDLPWSVAVGSEKARSEAIIYPVLQEVRRRCDRQVSLFSGKDFTVDATAELAGYVDFLISRSPEQLLIEAPVVVVTEAKKADLNEGLGQCVAEMVAAQRFNEIAENQIPSVYGVVSSGTQWRFLMLQSKTVTIDLTDYPLPPVDQILGFLVWMVKGDV